jgi:extracellular factor (EF) 3-hydroxypalmitic acid methyl ester biosynthesis protein
MFHAGLKMNRVFNGNGNGANGKLPPAGRKASAPAAPAPPSGGGENRVTFQTAEGIKLHGALSRVTRHIAVFELFNPAVTPRFSEVLTEFIVVMQARTVYAGRAVMAKVLDAGTRVVCEAMLDETGWKDADSERLTQHDGQISGEFKSLVREWQKAYQVLPEFKVVIADMQTFLQELRHWLERVETQMHGMPKAEREDLERRTIDQIARDAIPLVNVLFENFEALVEKISPDQIPAHSRYMRQHLHHLVLNAPFAQRTFEKPLGYAGDYETVNMIARNAFEGRSLFAKVLHGWFVQQPPAAAHRNRITYLTERLGLETQRVIRSGGVARVYNFACGPAVEVQHFLRSPLSDHAEVTLADFNKETLDHAGKTLEAIKELVSRRTRVRLQQNSVYQLLKEHQRRSPGGQLQFDFVYCAGLFDYLTDHTCRQLMNIFYDLVAPGGLLVATNVEPSNPLRHGMEHLLDWHLIYRKEPELRELIPNNAAKDQALVRTDATGVNLFLEIRKPAHD